MLVVNFLNRGPVASEFRSHPFLLFSLFRCPLRSDARYLYVTRGYHSKFFLADWEERQGQKSDIRAEVQLLSGSLSSPFWDLSLVR